MARDEEVERLTRSYEQALRDADRRLAKRPYERLPDDHPDFDAEDLPHWWQRWAVELVGAAVLVGIVAFTWWVSRPLGPLLPAFLDWLTELVT